MKMSNDDDDVDDDVMAKRGSRLRPRNYDYENDGEE